jgi:hypothetical protein
MNGDDKMIESSGVVDEWKGELTFAMMSPPGWYFCHSVML